MLGFSVKQKVLEEGWLPERRDLLCLGNLTSRDRRRRSRWTVMLCLQDATHCQYLLFLIMVFRKDFSLGIDFTEIKSTSLDGD